MRVLLVEDDAVAAQGLALTLKTLHAAIDQVDSGEEALELVRRYDYDVVVLDLMLPDIEGHEVVRRMRAARIDTPVLMLSGLSRSEAKVKAFGAGADDYLTKPFHQAELIARILAVTRRFRGFSQSTLRVGPLELNLDARSATVNGRDLKLTGKEFAIVELLVLRKGTVLNKEAFLTHLYGGMDEPELKIIDVFICKIRKKLAEAGGGELIGTVWGRGYMLHEPDSTRGPQPAGTPDVHTREDVGSGLRPCRNLAAKSADLKSVLFQWVVLHAICQHIDITG